MQSQVHLLLKIARAGLVMQVLLKAYPDPMEPKN